MLARDPTPQEPPPIRGYTHGEIDILREVYPEKGGKACQRLMPHHSVFSIYHAAQRLGLQKTVKWTERETGFIRTAINSGTALRDMVTALQSQGFDRSYSACKMKVIELKASAA